MSRVDIVALLDLGGSPSLAGHALAAQLEVALPGLVVHAGQADLGNGAVAGSSIDRAVARVLEMGPRVLGLGMTLWNSGLALEVARRLRQLAPQLLVVVGGPEAAARAVELERAGARLAAGAAAPALVNVLRELDRRPRRKGRVDGPAALYDRRVRDLVRTASATREPLLVEADWGARLPLWLASLVGLAGPGLDVEGATRRLEPVLRAGLPARLSDPALSGERETLLRLLGRLTERGPAGGTLELEVRAGHVDQVLVDAAAAAGVRVLTVDLGGGVEGERLRRQVRMIAARGMVCRGALVYGAPGAGHRALRVEVDRALRAGIDDLRLERLVVPPGSALRARADALGLAFAERPPYEALSHRQASFLQVLRGAQLAATLRYLSAPLAGTGLLRGLAETVGSPTEIVEGFHDALAASGRDLLEGEPAEPPERLFVEYLQREHHVDLDLESGKAHLVRAPYLSLRWLSDGRRLITDDRTGRVAHVGRHALAVLDGFDQARTWREVCEGLVTEAPLPQREKLRREIYRAVDKLAAMSFLVPAQEAPPAGQDDEEVPFTGLEEFDYHYRMLSDRRRMDAYRQAIESVIRPGDHAVEIGTGTGVLAVMAARAGARVTAIERFSVLGIARAVARESGVDERIRFIRGRSDLVEVEERGDVLISEIVGNRILNEGLLETTLDARRRLLRPGAALVPRRLEIVAELGHTDRFDQLEEELRRIGGGHGVSLDPLCRWFAGRVAAGQVVWEMGGEGDDFVPLTDAVDAVALDLCLLEAAEFSEQLPVVARRAGVVNAALLAFRLELAEGIVLSTCGQHALHWSKPVIMLRTPVAVAAGEPLNLRLSYERGGEIVVGVERAETDHASPRQ